MIASACLTLATAHLLIWCQRREEWAHALFALAALGTTLLVPFELWSMRAETPWEYGVAVRWAYVPFWLLFVSLVGFVRHTWLLPELNVVAVVVNFMTVRAYFRFARSERNQEKE